MAHTWRHILDKLYLNCARELRFFLGRHADQQDCEDVLHDAYLRLLEYAQPDDIREGRAFLFRTTRNIAIDRHRRRRTREHFQAYYGPADREAVATADISESIDSERQFQHFVAVLGELPRKYQEAFVLVKFENYTQAEAAARLGLSQKTVQRYVTSVLQHLEGRLASGG